MTQGRNVRRWFLSASLARVMTGGTLPDWLDVLRYASGRFARMAVCIEASPSLDEAEKVRSSFLRVVGPR